MWKKNKIQFKSFYLIILLLTVINFVNGQEIPIPENYSIERTVMGDLDNDSINEIVVVFKTVQVPEDADWVIDFSRELKIYKLEKNRWVEWKNSKQALYEGQVGTMSIDPFNGIEIKNGILIIRHFGGRLIKWGETDKYLFQDGEFYLNEYEYFSGYLTEYSDRINFNLLTGEINIKRYSSKYDEDDNFLSDTTEKEIIYKKGLKITIQRRQEQKIEITSPKFGIKFYISDGKD